VHQVGFYYTDVSSTRSTKHNKDDTLFTLFFLKLQGWKHHLHMKNTAMVTPSIFSCMANVWSKISSRT